MILANVESVQIELSRLQLKFQFPEDSLSMATTETIKLINKGSGPAKYSWIT